jgi:hypothetical protein
VSTLFALTLLVGLAGQFSPSPSTPKLPEHPRTLEISGEVKTGVPGFNYWGFPKQSDDGRLFFEQDGGGMEGAVVEIDPSTSDVKRYKLPADVADKYRIVKYSVTPNGDVWFMTCRKDALIVHAMEIDSSGGLAADTKLDWPEGVEPTEFQALQDGRFIVAGYHGKQAVPEERGQPFTGVFDKNGNLTGGLRFKKGDGLPKMDLATTTTKPHSGALVQGLDGTLYFLNGPRVYLVNASGKVTRTIKFDIPADDLIPRSLSVSGNLLAVWLCKSSKRSQLSFSFLVIDLTSDEVIGWYAPDPEGPETPVGFSRDDGFMFLKNDGVDWKLLMEQRK